MKLRMQSCRRAIPVILLLFLLLLVGCAHKTVKETPPDAAVQPIQVSNAPTQATPPATEETVDIEETDPFFDEFEEEFEQKSVLVADPLEPINRVMFHVNDKFYFILFKPVTQAYGFLIPEIIRIGIRNFFNNIRTPIRLTSCILQGKTEAAGTEIGRFMVNTTLGVLGFGDPAAKYFNHRMSEEDLGQTFGSYGIGNGFYLVIPFYGPTTLRDGIGDIGDTFLNPLAYVVDSFAAGVAIYAYRKVNETSFRIGDYETIKEAAIEPYEAIRDGYIQFRNAKIAE